MTDDPAPAYSKAIRKVKDKAALVKICTFYGEVTSDALLKAMAMDPKDLWRFKRDVKRASKESDLEWCAKFNLDWGDIVMPRKMMFASLIADQFKVPWGVAWIRAKEEGFPGEEKPTKKKKHAK